MMPVTPIAVRPLERERRRPSSSGCYARPKVPIGLLVQRRSLRLVTRPVEKRGLRERSTWMRWLKSPSAMFAAVHMLLSSEPHVLDGRQPAVAAILHQQPQRIKHGPDRTSREQVPWRQLYELMRGFQAANDVFARVRWRRVSLNTKPDA